MESILTSVKKMLGIAEEYEHFDPDIIMHINSVFMILTQLGVGPPEGFMIEGEDATWSEYISGGKTSESIEAVKTYVFVRVRLMFDPPQSSAVIESMNRIISELEWRLNISAETKQSETI